MDDLLTSEEVAKIRRCHEATVRKERVYGGGIPFLKIGRSVRYRRTDVEAFLNRCVRNSTSEAAACGA